MTDGLILPEGLTTFFDNNGDPLAGGKVYFYIPNTSDFKNTWQDGDDGTLNTNPVILDSAGRASIWGDGSYRQVVRDSLDNLIWDKLITLSVEDTPQTECGPVLYAGISTLHDPGNGDHQEIQFLYCDPVIDDESGPQNNTIVSWIAGFANEGTDITNFQIFLLDLEGDPIGSLLGYSVLKNSAAGPIELELGDIIVDNTYLMLWNEAVGAFLLLNPGVAGGIPNGSVTNAKLASRTGPIFIGRILGSSGAPVDMTPTEATALLDSFEGDSGTGGIKGLVPAPAAGDAADGRFLKADGSWAVPPGDTTGGGGAPDDAAYFLASPDGDLANARVPNDTATVEWDIATGGVFKANIVTNSVGSSQLAQIATATFLGRTTGGTGNVESLTATQATAMLNAMVGDNGAGGTKGLVPAPVSGDAAAGKFLKADGSWTAPPGTGAPASVQYLVGALDSGLSAEKVPQNSHGIVWDFSVGGQASFTYKVDRQVACSDETTPLVAATALVTFRMPYAMTVTAVRASLTAAAATGTITVDIKEAGGSILSTLLTIDATETTSVTAAVPPVISDGALADDAVMTVDLTDDADGAATGLKVTLIGTVT